MPLAIAGVVSASHLTPQHEDGSETAPEPQADVGKDTSDDNDSDRYVFERFDCASLPTRTTNYARVLCDSVSWMTLSTFSERRAI